MLPCARIGTHIPAPQGLGSALAFQAALMPTSETGCCPHPCAALTPHPQPESQEIFSLGHSTSHATSSAGQCSAFLIPNPKHFGAIGSKSLTALAPASTHGEHGTT